MRKKVNLADKAESLSYLKRLYATEAPKIARGEEIIEGSSQMDRQDQSFVTGKPRSFQDEGKTGGCKSKGNSGSV